MDQPAQESPGGDDDRCCGQLAAIAHADAGNAAITDDQFVRLAFDHAEVGGLVDGGLHRGGIELTVGLGARTSHRRTLAPVEHAKLDTRSIGDAAHQPVECVDLADQMALAEPADRRIARHRADGCKTMGHQRRCRTHARGCRRSFAAGVAPANDDDVK